MIKVLAVSLAVGWLLVGRAPTLSDVELNLLSIGDSGSYFYYEYELVNPATSTWGLAGTTMDVSASSGTPSHLTITGAFRDWPAQISGSIPHAEIGPSIPAGWRGGLTTQAELRWYVPTTLAGSPDSIAPGDTLSGIGIRSSNLPGLRAMRYRPTIQSCCSEPVDTTEEIAYALPSAYEASGWSVGPRYMPEEVDIDLLQSQLTAVCTDPLWLDDGQLCTELDDLLGLAEDEEDEDNFYGEAALLGRLKDRVSEERASMEANAYWLLSLNAAQAESNALDSASAVAGQWPVLSTSHGVLPGSGAIRISLTGTVWVPDAHC